MANETTDSSEQEAGSAFEAFARFRSRVGGILAKRPAKSAFWIWIAYQSIKGMITLSLIWIPLFLWWLNK